jgi:PAS domain S-box-containing protein
VSSPTSNESADSALLTEKVGHFLETVLRHETAVRAYEKWHARGRPEGSQIHDWLEAEAELAELRNLAGQLSESNGVLHEYISAREKLQEALARTEHRTRQLRGLAETALALGAASSPAELLQLLADRGRAIIGAHQAGAVFFPAGDSSRPLWALSLSEKYAAFRALDPPRDTAPLATLASELCRPLRLTQTEVESYPHWQGSGQAADRHPPLRGWLAAPLIGRDGVRLGVIHLSDREPGDFTEDDELILVQLAHLAAAAVEMRQTQEELEGRIRERTTDLARASAALQQEIRKHQEADEARQRNHALLRAIIDGTTDAVYAKDLQGRYLMINSAGARFLGKTVEEVVGKDDSALFSPETARKIMAQDRQILATGRTQTVEDVGTAAGATRTYLSTKGPYRDPQGQVIGLVGISRDITERKQAQRRLRAEHDVTRALAEAASLPEAARRILPAICQSFDWDLGIFWELDRRGEVLRCVEVWQAPDVVAAELEKTSRELTYSLGMGLPGLVWAQSTPVWSADVLRDLRILYRGPVAYQEGLHAAIAFPVHRGSEFLGVLEFFSREMRQPGSALLDTMSAITSQVSQFMERQKAEQALHERQREFAIARDIQQGLLPRCAPVLPGLAVAGLSLPAQETGGDYFDYFTLPDGTLGVAIGDASGHGIGAALLMAETRACLRILAQTHADLGQVLALANARLSEDVAEDHFVTLLVARLDPVAYTLTYSNAGHWPGYVLDFRGQIKAVLESTGVVLGFAQAGAFPTGPEVSLAAGDTVLLCTDGLAEAFSKDGAAFGKARILDLVRGHRHEAATDIVATLCHEVLEFAGEQQLDDMTAVVVKVE